MKPAISRMMCSRCRMPSSARPKRMAARWHPASPTCSRLSPSPSRISSSPMPRVSCATSTACAIRTGAARGAIRGLLFGYSRDLGEDKRAAFEAGDTLAAVLPAMAGMIATMRVDVARLRRQSTEGFTLATEIADWLSRRGVPFAEAHEITGALVRLCEDRGIGLEALGDADLAAVDARLTPAIRQGLTPEAAVAARVGYGGTAPLRVAEQLARLRRTLDEQREWAAQYGGPRRR